MTITIPDGVATLGNQAIYWLPAIANLTTGPTLAEMTAGSPIQCDITGFEASATQDSVEDVRLCTTDTFEAPGANKLSGGTLEYVYDPQQPTSATYKAYTTLVPGTKGYIVDRRGLPHGTAPAANQVVDIHTVTLGERNRVAVQGGKAGEKFKVSQRIFASGARYLDKKISA